MYERELRELVHRRVDAMADIGMPRGVIDERAERVGDDSGVLRVRGEVVRGDLLHRAVCRFCVGEGSHDGKQGDGCATVRRVVSILSSMESATWSGHGRPNPRTGLGQRGQRASESEGLTRSLQHTHRHEWGGQSALEA